MHCNGLASFSDAGQNSSDLNWNALHKGSPPCQNGQQNFFRRLRVTCWLFSLGNFWPFWCFFHSHIKTQNFIKSVSYYISFTCVWPSPTPLFSTQKSRFGHGGAFLTLHCTEHLISADKLLGKLASNLSLSLSSSLSFSLYLSSPWTIEICWQVTRKALIQPAGSDEFESKCRKNFPSEKNGCKSQILNVEPTKTKIHKSCMEPWIENGYWDF